jgi:ADP-ribose diphosphatase
MTGGASDTPLSKWTIHDERLVDGTRKMKVSIASVELPDGVTFEQYVFRAPRVAMTVGINSADEVLLIWRHRFIMDKWTWELPGGYVDTDEDPALAAVRELEEEAGWRARSVRLIAQFQPLAGSMDMENLVYLAEDLEDTGRQPDINEAERVEWIPLASMPERIAKGEVLGAGAQLGILHAARLRGIN